MASSPSKQSPPSLEKLWDGTVSLKEYSSYVESKENKEGGVESEPHPGPETEHAQVAPQEPIPQQQQKQDDESEKIKQKDGQPKKENSGKDAVALEPGRLPMGTLPQPKPIKRKPPLPLTPGPVASGSKK